MQELHGYYLEDLSPGMTALYAKTVTDADVVLWDPKATKTLSAKTQHSKGDFNIFEGRQVMGLPSHTISRGKLVYAHGDLRAERGAGQYFKRPAFGPNFQAVQKRAQEMAPTAVARA